MKRRFEQYICRYVNLFYRIYNGRRKHEILPMKF